IRTGHEHSVHVQPYGNDHRVCTPSMNFPHDPERNLLAEIANIDVCVLQSGPIVEHQQEPGEREHKKQEERDSAHAPRVSHTNAGLANLDWMQMKKNTAQHDEHTFAI